MSGLTTLLKKRLFCSNLYLAVYSLMWDLSACRKWENRATTEQAHKKKYHIN